MLTLDMDLVKKLEENLGMKLVVKRVQMWERVLVIMSDAGLVIKSDDDLAMVLLMCFVCVSSLLP